MKIRAMSIAAVLALAAAAGVSAQSPEHTFTATGSNCTQIVWSQEILAKYPRIAVAPGLPSNYRNSRKAA